MYVVKFSDEKLTYYYLRLELPCVLHRNTKHFFCIILIYTEFYGNGITVKIKGKLYTIPFWNFPRVFHTVGDKLNNNNSNDNI